MANVDNAKIARMYERGDSMQTIGESMGLSVTTVRRSLLESGVQPRPKGRPPGSTHVRKIQPQDRAKIVTEYAKGATSDKLALKYGVSKERICQICRAAGVIRPGPRSKKK